MYYNINIRLIWYRKHIGKVNYTCMVSLANKVGCPTKVVWPIALFSNSKHFLYNFCVGHWLADITWCRAKTISRIHLYFILDHKSKVN